MAQALRPLLRASPAEGAPPPRWLRRAAALALAPGLCAAPVWLEAVAEALSRPAGRAERPPPVSRPIPTEMPGAARPAPRASPASPEGPRETAPELTSPPRRPAGAATPARPAPVPPPPLPETEVFSPAAGLLLALTPLRKAGFAEWLAERPDLAARGFGPAFVADLARVGARKPDPLHACLAPWPGSEPPDPVLARAWRRGLDGWLRRRAGRRLHDLAGRGGWLIWTEGRIEARYPAAAADLALRRRGLDADPGWIPWFGRSLRYRFADEPAS